ncbi:MULTISPECIES: YrhB domain-containing protein [Catenuloplanes]|uniref:Immunity protein 35 domain-containing protein n=1 Tax=Catenuloplanes niger TaxID=587534 RepID=A0AAE4CTI3_9ACTN|nr:YrhB domain-containing protein [Catenuloplanes niger]MDR7323457.1 hypothetical protein [Catenuloplanes niger]
MIDEARARHIAEKILAQDATRPGTPTLAIVHVQEHPIGWVFYYDSAKYVRTGNFMDATVGNAPIVVERATGQAHITGTARSTGYYLTELDAGTHACTECPPAGRQGLMQLRYGSG